MNTHKNCTSSPNVWEFGLGGGAGPRLHLLSLASTPHTPELLWVMDYTGPTGLAGFFSSPSPTFIEHLIK